MTQKTKKQKVTEAPAQGAKMKAPTPAELSNISRCIDNCMSYTFGERAAIEWRTLEAYLTSVTEAPAQGAKMITGAKMIAPTYVKKIWSYNPNEYKFITLTEAISKYADYIKAAMEYRIRYPDLNNIHKRTELKTFDQWLETEI